MSQLIQSPDQIDKAFDQLIAQLSEGALPECAPLPKTVPLAVYGMGGFGREICRILQAEGYRIAGCLDRQGTGALDQSGLPVYPITPESVSLLKGQGVATVVIGVFNGHARLDEIVDLLSDKQTGFERVITPMELQELFPDLLGWRYWMTPRKWYLSHVQKLIDSLSIWADAESSRVYKEALLFRAGWHLSCLQDPDMQHQYFPPSLPTPGTISAGGLRLVDGGAYNGDTLEAFVNSGADIEMVYSFEPDLQNFNKLSACAQSIGLTGRALLWPCGLWSSTTVLHFQDNQGAGSHITAEKDISAKSITVTSLDEVLSGQVVNLIKLDIEGAEIEALNGSRETLRRHRPALAVCTYHHPEHLWEVAEQIQTFDLGYKLFLRSHLYNSFELVLYGLPS